MLKPASSQLQSLGLHTPPTLPPQECKARSTGGPASVCEPLSMSEPPAIHIHLKGPLRRFLVVTGAPELGPPITNGRSRKKPPCKEQPPKVPLPAPYHSCVGGGSRYRKTRPFFPAILAPPFRLRSACLVVSLSGPKLAGSCGPLGPLIVGERTKLSSEPHLPEITARPRLLRPRARDLEGAKREKRRSAGLARDAI